MAILSTFDPWLKNKELNYYIDKFWTDHVMIIERSIIFAILKIVFPAIVFVLTIVAILRATEAIDSSWAALTFLGLPLTVIIVIVMVYRLWKVYIDYTMDFTIVTPEQIISYNQTFLLSRRVRTIQTSKIKTVSISKNGIIYSLFDNGDINVLSEGDQTQWEINLNRVKDPEWEKRSILHIVDVAKKMESE